MSQPEYRIQPRIVSELMLSILDALGTSSKSLVDKSQTDIGTLAVKSAGLVIDFDISSEAVLNTTDGSVKFGIGALTGSMSTSTNKDVRHSHATITLEIVSVAWPKVEPASDPQPKPEPPPVEEPAWKTRLRQLLSALQTQINELRIDPAIKATFGRGLDQILASATQSEARSKLLEAMTYLRNATLDVPLPADVRQALDDLAQLLG